MREPSPAWHEAGHAAMALATGLPVRFVAIGRYAAPYAGIVVSGGTAELRRSYPGLHSLSLALIAGEMAERIYAGEAHVPEGAGADRHSLRAIADELGFHSANEQRRYLRHQRACAIAILTRLRNWRPVEMLADALLDSERLDEAQVRRLFDAARHRAIAYPDALLHQALAAARRRLLAGHRLWPGLARDPEGPRPPGAATHARMTAAHS